MRIVTHTPSQRCRYFEAAISSASLAMEDSSASHLVIDVPEGEYYEARKAAWQMGGYVGLLDSDDTFPSGFHLRDFEPHLTGVGVVYGREMRVDSDGSKASDLSTKASAEGITERASALHHFAAINTDCIDREVFAACEREGAFYCLDWVVRSYAALVHGATFVDCHSYNWRQHKEQVTHAKARLVVDSFIAASKIIRSFYDRRCSQWRTQIRR